MPTKSREERRYDRYVNRVAAIIELFFRRKLFAKTSVIDETKIERIKDEETGMIVERKVPVIDESTGNPKKQIKVILSGDTIAYSYYIDSKMNEFKKKYPDITFFVDF